MLRSSRIWLVELITASRLLAGLLFASLAFQHVPRALLVGLYGFAIGTDLLDGFIARRLRAVTYLGKVLDLISDKSITIVSLLYAGARGIDLLPLAFIGSREIISLGARSILVDGLPLLPSNRLLGGFMALMVWGSTMVLILTKPKTQLASVVNILYWLSGVVFVLTMFVRICSNAHRIKAFLARDSTRGKDQKH
jgi:phosphatidylglycerophosphate synthase